MRRYETIFIVRPNVAEDEIEAVISKTTSIIESDGGTIISIDKWGLRKLAYLIKKESQGYYVYINFGTIPASVSEMERIFRIDDRVMKYLTVKLEESCDPVAIKEEMALAEAAKTSAAAEAEEEKAAPSEVPKAKVKEEKAAPSEAPEAKVKEEEAAPSEVPEAKVKEEEASPSEVPEAEVKEEEASPSDEEKDAR